MSEPLFSRIVELALDAIVTIDEGGGIVDFNPAAERIFGYLRNEVVGAQMADLLIPEHLREQHRTSFARYLETRHPSILGKRLELTAKRKDGQEFPVELTVNVIAPEGEPLLFAAHIRDISDRVHTEAELRSLLESTKQAVQMKEESLALLDTLLATAPVGLAFVDRDLRYVRINNSMAAMTAAGPDQHLGRTIREMLPDLADVVEPLHRRVIENGEPVLDVELTGAASPEGDRGHWLASYYPVRGPGGEVIGVGAVIVDITERKVAEVELLGTRRELANQLEDLTRLLQLSGNLSGSLELQPVLDEVLRAVIGLQEADAGVLRLYDPERGDLEAVASEGVSPSYLERLRRVAADHGVWGRAFAERRPAFSEDVEQDEGFEEVREVMLAEGFRAVYTSPLITRRGDLIGTIATHFHRRRKPTERQARLIELYAYEAADVIDNARLFRDAREAQERLEFLAEASRILSASLDYARTLQEVARLVVPRLADWCTIEIKEEDGAIRQVAMAHVDPEKIKWARELQEKYPPDPNAPTGAPNVIRTGKSELYPEIPAELMETAIGDDRELQRIVDEIGFASMMVVPLIARGRTLGALSFVTAESGRHYGPRDLAVAEDLARRGAQAVDNARLFTRQRHIARTLQESLLPPSLPVIPGVEIAARYEAAGEGTEVGGDFYDVFETVRGEWGVVMGDVCGKGPEAAAVTGLARYTIRAAAMRDTSPASILTTLNEAIRQQRSDLRFATVAYLRLRKDNGNVEVEGSCGGHPLPLVLRREGGVETVGRPGTLLGIFEDADLENDRAQLEPGDAVVLYTDGVSQERDEIGALTEEDLAELVAGSMGMGADAIADRILEAVKDESSGEARDDIAILVVRVQP
ncbi:MAG: SpoIIE family protein phosphatase [Actinomycetota bacterium]